MPNIVEGPRGTTTALWQSPYMSAVAAILLLSGTMVMIRGVAYDVPPVALIFWRAVLGASLLVAFAWRHLRVELPMVRQRWRVLALCGVLHIVVGGGGTVAGLQDTTVVNAAVLSSFLPMTTVLFAWALGRDTVTRMQVLGIAVSALGVLVLIARGNPASLAELDVQTGDLWILVSVFGFALYSAIIRDAAPGMHWMSLTAAVTTLGLLCLLPIYLYEHFAVRAAELDAALLVTAGYLGILGTFGAVSLWNRAVRLLGPSRAGPINHLGPVFGIVLGIMFLGEALEPYHLAGIALIVPGIYLAAVLRRRAPAGSARRAE